MNYLEMIGIAFLVALLVVSRIPVQDERKKREKKR